MHDDQLIDRAAQAMTRGEPSPRLRGAVRARIAHSRPVPPARYSWRPWIPALAGAAIVIVAITVWRTLLEPPGELVRSTRIASAASVMPPVTLQPAPVSVQQVDTSERASGPARPRPRSIVVDPLVIEPINVPLMAVDSSSGVMPLEIELLQIEPLQSQ
jgi:hypothetical protein